MVTYSRTMCTAVAILAVAFASAESTADDLVLDDVLAEYQAGCDKLSSYDVQLKHSTQVMIERAENPEASDESADGDAPKKETRVIFRRVSDESQRRKWSWTNREQFRRESYRVETIRTDEVNRSSLGLTIVWDGDWKKRYSPVRKRGWTSYYHETIGDHQGKMYSSLYRNVAGDLSYLDFIRVRRNVTVRRDKGLIILTAPPIPREEHRKLAGVRFKGYGVRMFLDPAKSFLPIRIEFVLPDQSEPQSRCDIVLTQIQPGMWAPTKARSAHVFWYKAAGPEFYGQDMVEDVIEVDLERSQFLNAIPDETFAFEFPPGTDVK